MVFKFKFDVAHIEEYFHQEKYEKTLRPLWLRLVF
jgi:hypothetical protein